MFLLKEKWKTLLTERREEEIHVTYILVAVFFNFLLTFLWKFDSPFFILCYFLLLRTQWAKYE